MSYIALGVVTSSAPIEKVKVCIGRLEITAVDMPVLGTEVTLVDLLQLMFEILVIGFFLSRSCNMSWGRS